MLFRGRWVLVTGASSGLGEAFARQLAKKHGANIVAVARRLDRLEALKRELEAEAHVEVLTIAADLSSLVDVDRVAATVTSGPRAVYAAVLNAGVTYFGLHEGLAWDDFDRMLRTNVTSVVRLANALVPQLRSTGDGGGLLIVSSMAGVNPVAYQTAYSASKAFLVHFGLGLYHELHGTGVSVTTYAPAGIATEMTSGRKFAALRAWLAPVDQVAAAGIEAFQARKYFAIPGATNKIGDMLCRVLPRKLVAGQLASVYRKALSKGT
jgi:short-subunit dehydrogenase